MSHAVTEERKPGEPPHIHHMDSVTAYHSAKFGMWMFLATEVLLFGGLFCAFALFRWMYLDGFHEASQELSVPLGATNTVVLLISSFFAALAVDAAQHGNNKKVITYLSVTLTCAVGFLIIKGIEYHGKWQHGLFPFTENWTNGAAFHGHEGHQAFFGLYFIMTGLHALHVLIGMVILIWAMRKAFKKEYSQVYYTPVEMGALYWHLVDLIWIYLFPLLYLVG